MNFFNVFRDQYTTLPISVTPDTCRRGTYIITGANSGLGYECAKHLVHMHASRVILAVRSIQSGEDAKKTIESSPEVEKSSTSGEKSVVEVWQLDLSSFDSVRSFADRVVSELDRVDAVIENAAVAMVDWRDGDQGWEMNMTVNVMSTMLLTTLLIPHLRKVGRRHGIVPRIAVIGSGVAFMAESQKALEKVDKENILFDIKNRTKWESSIGAYYPFSKLLLFLSLQQLASLAPVDKSGVIVTFVNPGICYTNLNRNSGVNFSIDMQVKIARIIMGRTAEMGSRTLLHGAVAGEECHGNYISECELKDYYVPEWVKDASGQKVASQVWKEMTEKLESLAPGCVEKVI